MKELAWFALLVLLPIGCKGKTERAAKEEEAIRHAVRELQPFFTDARTGKYVIVTANDQGPSVQLRRKDSGSIWVEVPLKLVSDRTSKKGGEVAYFESRRNPPVLKSPDTEILVAESKTAKLTTVFKQHGTEPLIRYLVAKDEDEYHQIIGGLMDSPTQRQLSRLVVKLFEVLAPQHPTTLSFEHGGLAFSEAN